MKKTNKKKYYWIIGIIIVIILIIFSLAYTWFFGCVFCTLTGIATSNPGYTPHASLEITSANYSNSTVVATIKNTGNLEIQIYSAYIITNRVSNVTSKINSAIYPIEPNETETIDILNTTEVCNSMLLQIWTTYKDPYTSREAETYNTAEINCSD